MRSFPPIVILPAILLAACATSSPGGRTQFVAPTEISAVYSEVDMRLKLAATADVEPEAQIDLPCLGALCDTQEAFRRKVVETGERLSAAAGKAFPDLAGRVPGFDFAVAVKEDAYTVSNAAGAVVVLDGVRRLGLDDEALAFLIAREMGHVIGRHHDEDSATNIIMSVAAGVLLPMTNIVRVLAVLPGAAGLTSTAATGTTAAAASVATTAVSLAGSTLMRASYRADQVREADAIALQLMANSGSELHDVAAALAPVAGMPGDDKWSNDLRGSLRRLDQLACGPRWIPREDGREAELALSMSFTPSELPPERQ